MTISPGLTVVILTYDSANTVSSTLQALVEQENPDFDVIVVDDDSTDGTLSVVQGFSDRLRLTVARNGSHCIPRGRNIGLELARTVWVAFVDSDDRPAPDWTKVVVAGLAAHPDAALISGDRLPAYRTSVARAIALNDDAIRRLAGGGVMRFCASNCAINRDVWPDARFDESFAAAEDLELVSRARHRFRWVHLPEVRVHQYSRDTFRGYARQMYRYGFMKQLFAAGFGTFRPADYVPLALFVSGAVLAAVLPAWWPLALLVPFSLAEAVVVVVLQFVGAHRCPPMVAALTFPAWLVKNVAWSCGVVAGVVRLARDSRLRDRLRTKRATVSMSEVSHV